MDCPVKHEPRPELEAMPPRIKRLAIDARGYPVPYFVAWIDGKPDHRVADARKWHAAVREKRCWVCGDFLGVYLAFTIGPMCGINRTTAEPPEHLECARWSVRNCPFMSRPHAERREAGLPDNDGMAGLPILRNPGVMLIWNTTKYTLFPDQNNRPMIRIGTPTSIEAWYMGKPATREQLRESVETGLPALTEIAQKEGEKAVAALKQMVEDFWKVIR